jgi:hypothetical protein
MKISKLINYSTGHVLEMAKVWPRYYGLGLGSVLGPGLGPISARRQSSFTLDLVSSLHAAMVNMSGELW